MERRDNLIKRELYLFWGRHPNAKFSGSAISIALDCSTVEMARMLRAMVDAGLVETHTQNGVTFYLLTKNEERRRQVIEFARHRYNWW